MIDLFYKRRRQLLTANIKPPMLNNIKRAYYLNISKVLRYYYINKIDIRSDNILVKILSSMSPNIHLDIVNYYFDIINNYRTIANNNDICTTYNVGKFLKGVFFKNSTDVLLLNENMGLIEDIKKYDNYNMYNVYSMDSEQYPNSLNDLIQPCRLIYTNDISLNLPYLDGRYNMSKTNKVLNIVEIDIIKLCLEFRRWVLYRLKNNLTVSYKDYITQIVLPRMIINHLDISIINRYLINYNVTKEKEIINGYVPITFLNNKVMFVINNIRKNNNNKPISINEFLNNIPTICNNTLDVLFINNSKYTSSNSWVVWLARLPYICSIIDAIGDRGKRYNLNLLNKLPLFIREIRNRSIRLLEILPHDLKEEYLSYIDYINSNIYKL